MRELTRKLTVGTSALAAFAAALLVLARSGTFSLDGDGRLSDLSPEYWFLAGVAALVAAAIAGALVAVLLRGGWRRPPGR
jgi:hypothetical protein